MFVLRRGTSHVLNYNLNEELKLQASRTMRNSGPLAHLAGYLRSIQIILTLFEHWSWKSMKIARSSSHQKQSIFNEKTISRQVKNHEMSLLYLQFVKQILSFTITYYHRPQNVTTIARKSHRIAKPLRFVPNVWTNTMETYEIPSNSLNARNLVHGYHDLCQLHPELRQMQLKCMYWQQVVLTKVFVFEMSWAPSFMTIIKASGAPMRKSTGTSGALKAAWPYALRALAAKRQDPKTKKNGRRLNSDDVSWCVGKYVT